MIVKRLAGIANLASSLWILYLVYLYPTFYLENCRGCSLNTPLSYDIPVNAMLVVGLILVIDSGACLAGRWLGFPMGALLSLVTIPLMLLKLYYFGVSYIGIGVVLAVTAVALDAMATVSRTKMSEQSHPLNLPVFG